MEGIFEYALVIVSALFVASEVLAELPFLKSNSVFQFIRGVLGFAKGALDAQKIDPESKKDADAEGK